MDVGAGGAAVSGEQSALAEPGLDVVAVLGDLFAPDGQAGTDLRPGTGLGVDALGAAEAADGVGDERVDRLAGEVVARRRTWS